jgi:hypothetical protein
VKIDYLFVYVVKLLSTDCGELVIGCFHFELFRIYVYSFFGSVLYSMLESRHALSLLIGNNVVHVQESSDHNDSC